MISTPNDGNTLLHFAARDGNIVLIDSLLKCGQGINTQNGLGRTPLHIAYKEGKLEAAVHLIQHGADTNIRDNDGNMPSELETCGMK